MFYTQDQNNTGGSFDFDEEKGLTHFVVVEADSIEEAEEKASDIGIYYNGCEEGLDCPCCGDRWYGFDDPTKQPEVYGKHPKDSELLMRWMGDDKEICIHYKDGRKEWY